MESVLKLIESIEHCLLPKLARNFDECENHAEYDVRKVKLDEHFPSVTKLLGDLDLRSSLELAPSVLSTLLIMYKELKSDGPWNTEKSKEYSKQLNHNFKLLYEIALDDLLRTDSIFNIQDVFNKCIENLHRKLTPDDIKKYPGRIEVYCSIIQNLKEYKVKVNPLKTLPVCVLLIDDYMVTNKVKGLKCCITIIQCLPESSFQTGNYYDVVYVCLKKVFTEKDLDVTKLTLECILELLKKIPSNVKPIKLDDTFSSILEQLLTESNLHRKVICFRFTKQVIEMHRVNCVRKKKNFNTVVSDNLDICGNEAVADVLLVDILECLEMWIKYCWCSQKMSSDQKLLSAMFKILYECKNEKMADKIQNLIVTLISLCTKEDQNKILKNLEKMSKVPNQEFLRRLDLIREYISA